MKFYMSKPEDPPRSSGPDWNGLPNPPATRSNVLSPKTGQDLILLNLAAINFMKDLNPGKAKEMPPKKGNWTYLTWPGTGQFNQSSDTWWKDGVTPKFETIGYVWNVYAGFPEDKTYPGYVKIATVNHSAPMPDVKLHNWKTEPWLYHVMSSITPEGDQHRIGKSYSLFVPMFARSTDKPLYHKLSDLEPFPDLPMEVTINSSKNVDVHVEPSTSSEVVYSLSKGDVVSIKNYAPRGNDIWASMTDKDHNEFDRWICLRHATTYYTKEWKLDTPAVLTPVEVFPLDKKAEKFQKFGHKLED